MCILLVSCLFRSAELDTTSRISPKLGKSIIDMHVHVAGLGYGSDNFLNQEMLDNIRFPVYMWAMGVTKEELKKYGDQIMVEKLSKNIAESKSVSKAVILALDGFVDSEGKNKGKLNKSKTQIYVANDYVAEQSAKYDNLIFGASVNPNRHDALDILRKVKSQGAVLVKWIPSIMNIDPNDPKHADFYKLMVELKLALLTHTGMEKAFAGAVDSLADPLKLKLPLSLGVTVIAAHIATTGKSDGEDNFARILPMFKKYPNLYADISSLTQINKVGYLVAALKNAGVKKRLLYGTDWPLQFYPLVSPWYHIADIKFKDAYTAGGIENQWDRDVAIKTALGVPASVFMRAKEVLEIGE